MRGTILDGRYTLTERVGAGGMGEVWRATDARLDRKVAVKLLSLPPGADDGTRERLLAMFVREARAAAALDSSYIVPVFDHGTGDGHLPYIVMPLLNGRTLREMFTGASLPPPAQVAGIAAQVCRALDAAHAAGVVHRDIKPPNVMLTDEGTVKVLDFGVAKFTDAATGDGFLTRTSDSPVGTLHYMAPERFTRAGEGSPVDLYALGCMLYEMLTGTPPFDVPSAAALIACHLHETPAPPSTRRPELAPQWDELLAHLLAKDPAKRPTAQQARAALEGLAAPDDRPAPGPVAVDTPADSPTSYRLAPPRPATPPTPSPSSAEARVADGGSRGRRTWWISAGAAVAVAGLVTSVVVFNPFDDHSSGTADGGSGPSATKSSTVAAAARTNSLSTGTAKDSQGPAPAVRGAVTGGTITVLEPESLTTIDPASMWSGTDRIVSRLVYRSLTALKTQPDGTVRLVGDLAEDPGRPSSGGRDWTFTLKPGLTYNDGTPVQAQDFAYAIERALQPGVDTAGDTTLRRYLLGTKNANGNVWGDELPPGIVEAPDARTIVYHLRDARPDFNLTLAGPSGAPVPKSAGSVSGATATLPSTGPYEISSFSGARKLSLTRNKNWKAGTDPLRTAYPDAYEIEGGLSLDEIKSRTTSARSGEAVMSFTGGLDKDGLGKAGTSGSGTRRVSAPSPYTQAYLINTTRVKKLKTRQAIATALPAADVLAASGEDGTVTHHLMPPGISGSRDFDLYGAGAHGDPDKARTLLKQAGQLGLRLTLAFATAADEKRAKVVGPALERAGFKVTLLNVDVSDYYAGAGDGTYDLFRLPVGGALPSASTYLPDYFDGTHVYPDSSNYSRLRSADVDTAIDSANATTTPADAATAWSTVDRRVMEQAAAVPVYVSLRTFLYSDALHGVQVDLDGLSPLNAYIGEERQ